jgi:hypothetical protein
VVVLAQEEARLLNHNYIGTEHLLLGLIHEGDGIAAKALERLGVSLDVVRARVEEIIGHGSSAPSGHIPFTPRAKTVLELSLREALQLGHNYIGTEHLLLGLIREGEGVAAQVLAQLGLDLARVRQEVIQLLSGSAPPVPGLPRTRPADTPAGARAREEARRLAGELPVGTHHVVSAILQDHESLGAKALEALGVTADALDAELARLSPADTTDELPEEAGARRIRVEILDNAVAVFVEDDALRERLANTLEGDPKVLRADQDAAVASFPGLWRDLTRHLADIAALLDREAAEGWRPPEWEQEWDVAAYAVVQGPGGMRSLLEVAEGLKRNKVRAALAKWLTDHQPTGEGSVTYMAILVRASGLGKWIYEVSFGDRSDWPRTQAQYLIAHAIFDLTAESGGRRWA